MEKKILESIEAKIKERYQDTKEDHTVCGKYSKLLQVARQAVEEEGQDLLVKRLRLQEGKLSHSVLWNDEVEKEVLFLVTEGENFLGCAAWKIPVEDRKNPDIFSWEDHGETKSRWLKQEYLSALFED